MVSGFRQERAWVDILLGRGYVAMPSFDFTDNNRSTGAPMLSTPGSLEVLPDVLAWGAFGAPSGRNQVWMEVKAKTRPGYRFTRGRWEHGIDKCNFDNYVRVGNKTELDVMVVFFEEWTPVVSRTADGVVRLAARRDEKLITVEHIGQREHPPLIRRQRWLYVSLEDAGRWGQHEPAWPDKRGGRGGMGGWLIPRSRMTHLKPQLEMFRL